MKALAERPKPTTDEAATAIPKTAKAGPPLSGQTLTPWLAVVLVVVLFSGGLFGYDQGVISGALHGIKATFSLSALLVEVVTSWVTLGALLGALAAGELADQIGRKRTVLIAGAMFTLGAVVQALAPDTVVLVAGPADHRRRGRRGRRRRTALCRRTGTDNLARPVRLRLPTCHHHRHLPRLPDRWLAVE